ncbi:MAG: site-2 protease family protein [Clostridiales bacterium]|nr:site-2 protease family protein [Clostridiales bacterium]
MFNFDKRILYLILGIFVLSNIIDRLTSLNSVLTLLISLPAILIAITFHEFAHAFAADKLGDDTPRNQGRLTLNPFKHIDIFGFALLIIAGFGWGKSVHVNPRNFKRNISMTKAEAIVASAGPITNLILAIISTIILAVLLKFNLLNQLNSRVMSLVLIFIFEVILINLGLGIFNLIPLPPLDGSKILNHFLPFNIRNWFEMNQYILYMVFIIIWITGIASKIITPCIKGVMYGIFYLVGQIFNIELQSILQLFGIG